MTAAHPWRQPRALCVQIRPADLWQRRFWEHAIRGDSDYVARVDYCHINPVKHGYAQRVSDWPYSTFHRYVERGVYPQDWAGGLETNLI